MPREETRQLAAIMFTDIVGYTSMMAENEQTALAAVNTVRTVLTTLVKKHNGVFRKEIGDGTLSSFSSAVDASLCAIEFQRSIQTEPFKIRIGIHVGEVTVSQNDIYGDGVNIASRIEPLAPPGGIFVSDRVYEDIQNKTGIDGMLVGIRELKNVSRAIKVFALVGDGLVSPSGRTESSSFKFWITDLWQRRFIQIISVYIVMAFVVVRAIDSISNSYLLSPHWGYFSFVLLVSILPSIGVIAYYHGKGGLDRWVNAEKITLPVNAIFTGILLFVLFEGKQLGPTTETISFTDEEGKRVERAIAKAEFRKRIAIYGFKNNTGSSALDWWTLGIPTALKLDLYQDVFIKVKGPFDLGEEIQRSSQANQGDLPLSLMRKIAQDYRLDYFLQGEFSGKEGALALTYKLYDANNANLIAENYYPGQNPFEAVDQIAVQIKKDLEIPDSHVSSTSDLPIISILSKNTKAYNSYILAAYAMTQQNDFETGIKHLEEAVEVDPEFAQAHLLMSLAYAVSNRLSLARVSMEKAMDHLYALPERDQFLAKSYYYYFIGESEKRIKVLRMWLEFYPEDVEAVELLGLILQLSGELDQAKDLYSKAIQIDDNGGDFNVKLAEILEAQQDRERALSFYQRYAEKYPTHSRSFQLLGNFYLNEGDFEMANQHFEKALLLDERNIILKGDLALVKERMGGFSEALSSYQAILEECKNLEDSLNIIDRIKDHYFTTGELNTGIDWWELYLTTAEKTRPPIYVSMMRTTRLEWYMKMDRPEEALRIIQEEEEKFKDSFSDLISFGYMNYFLTLKDAAQAEVYMDNVMDYVSKYGSPGSIEVYYRAELSYIKEEYQDALALFQKFNKTNVFVPKSFIDTRIAKCLWFIGKQTEAIQVLEEYLITDPHHPEANYELALFLSEIGENERAIELLGISLEVWKSADPEYRMANAAKEKYEQLTSSLSRISG